MNKILSVSVASYNVEIFIKQNIESFLNTSVSSKIEVLIIDDGSKDNTAKIAEEYQNKYPETIRLIKQKNGGPGSTVNTGIRNASGKYFRMVDGDDWVNTSDLEFYINFLEKNDIDVVYTDYCLVDNDTLKEIPQNINFEKKNTILRYDDVCNRINASMHNVTYKTSILKDNNIVLDNCFYTDMEYLLYPVRYAKSIVVLDCLIYMYRVSLSTQSMNINSMVKNKMMHEKVLKNLLEDFSYNLAHGNLSNEKENFIRDRLLTMAGAHLSIILAQNPDSATKCELKDFVKFLYKNDTKLYEQFINLKTMKLLTYSNYLLFNLVSRLHRRKNNVEN